MSLLTPRRRRMFSRVVPRGVKCWQPQRTSIHIKKPKGFDCGGRYEDRVTGCALQPAHAAKAQGLYDRFRPDAGARDWCQYSHVQCAEYVSIWLTAVSAIRKICTCMAHVITLSK